VTLDQYIEELIQLRDQHTAGDMRVLKTISMMPPPKPNVASNGGGGKWVVFV